MSDRIRKYIDALDVPDADHEAAMNGGWPAGLPRRPTPSEYPLEHQFLDDQTIGSYLEGLRQASLKKTKSTAAGAWPSGLKLPSDIAFASQRRDWSVEKYPLVLCEYLAYKSGLAYRSPKVIRRDLTSVGSNGRPYNEGIGQYAFFDSSHPSATVRYGDTQAYAFVQHRTGYVIFRGTSSLTDLATDLHDELTDAAYPRLETIPQTLVGKPRPARHTGFAIAWGSVAPDIVAWTADQLRNGRMDRIVFSGHSLGGALAVLAGHHFASERICPVHAVITFGAPMVGGADFKASYESSALGLKDRTLLLESSEDLVAILTKRANDYQHVGHRWRFKQRPLRPTWQMVLFSPLVDAEQAATRKIERIEQRRVKRTKPDGAASPASSSGSNSRRNEAPRSWQQFFIGFALKVLWYLIRFLARSIAAHSVEQRYGLFLSTLAYRQIRAHRLDEVRLILMSRRGQENERIITEQAYRVAGEDLGRHLGVARGRDPRTFRHLARRPIRISTPDELAAFEKKYPHYIA